MAQRTEQNNVTEALTQRVLRGKARRESGAEVKQVGVVGIDSSHLPEFTRRINAAQAAGWARLQVTQYWTDGEHAMEAEQVAQWRRTAEAEGAVAADSLDAMLEAVDGVMVLGVDGHKHLQQALPALERGLPTYIDKPLACDADAAGKLLETARRTGAPCYSASSLRFADEVRQIDREAVGDLVAIDAYGPGETHPVMSNMFFYGVHTIEMVDAVWGPGVAQVSAVTLPDRDLVDLRYHDGRYARLRLERRGCYEFGATVHGTRGIQNFRVNFTHVYDRLVDQLVRFFEHGDTPVDLRDTAENVAVMSAADASAAEGGAWVDVPTIS